MEEKHGITIYIPENISQLPIQILKSSNHQQIIFSMRSESETYADELEKKYVLIWRQQDYQKVLVDDIVWIKADKSYSCIHLKDGHAMTISSNLSSVEERLPAADFLRIHRSYLVNLRHVESLMGNSLKIGNEYLTIGREYLESVLDRFIFLGVRRKSPK